MAESTTIVDAGTITHYSAQIFNVGYWDPLRGAITDAAILGLANNGYSPDEVTPHLQARADRIKAALMAGKFITTKTAEIAPVTTADYYAGRLSPIAGTERLD